MVKSSQPHDTRQLGPKGRGDLRTSPPHRNHAARVALHVIASEHGSDFAVYFRVSLGALSTNYWACLSPAFVTPGDLCPAKA
jgi:hypothetical protein